MAILQQTAVELGRSNIENDSLQIGESVEDFAINSQWSGSTSLYQLLEKAYFMFIIKNNVVLNCPTVSTP